MKAECREEEIVEGYQYLLSFEMDKRMEELKQDDYKWINPERIDKINKFTAWGSGVVG